MVEIERRRTTTEELFANLDPVIVKWFKSKFKDFSESQRYAVMNIHRRENTLVSAPTGSGKTLSAFLSILNELVSLSRRKLLDDKVYCVYISPLKALNNDIERNLNGPLSEIRELLKEEGHDLDIRVAVRTGDTPVYARAKMVKRPPHILITTPETLGIVLVAPSFKENLRSVKWVIVDEIHALAENKRGVHLSVSLERLQTLAGGFCRIGLSATIHPLDEVAQFLVGYEAGKPRGCKIIDVNFNKKLDLKVISPVRNIMNVTQSQLVTGINKTLHKLIQEHRTTLIFTNTRAATERVVHGLKTVYPKFYNDSNIGAHHSSLSKEHRLSIERRLKEGALKVVVSSTSLELGIDIGYVDLVVLLSSPKSVYRAMQRIGRSGHKLADTIKGRFVIYDRDDLMECALIMKNALERKLDRIDIPKNCLDVLSQHIYGICIEGRNYIENVYSLVRQSYCYKGLSKKDFMSVLKYLAGDFAQLEYRRVYSKIWYDEDAGEMGKRGKLARVLYSTNIGTIPDESHVQVKIGEQIVGYIDEAFLERLKKGDIFVLGGSVYEYKYARGMTLQVASAVGRLPTVPSWFSDMLPLSFDLAMSIQKFRRLMEDRFKAKQPRKEILKFIKDYLYMEGDAANSVYEYLREQYLFSKIAHDKRLLIEFYNNGSNKQVVFHSCYGRRVNDVLSRAIAYAISMTKHFNVQITLTDHGFSLSADRRKLSALDGLKYLNPENLRDLLEVAVDRTEVLKRRFRHCAGRSLMILRNYKGRRKTAGRQQVSSQILINACREISYDFPILREARREVLEDLMDIKNCELVLRWLKDGKIKVGVINTQIPSPFALNIVARGYSDILKMEDKLEFIRRMHSMVLARLSLMDKNGNG